jgi:hypothetical protein
MKKRWILIAALAVIVVALILFFTLGGVEFVYQAYAGSYSSGPGALASMSETGNAFEDLNLNPYAEE